MRIVAHHSKFYDWEPVPADVVVTDADKASGNVKPMAKGSGWLMRVTKAPPGGTHTTIAIPEHQIVAKIIDEKTRPTGGRTLTRKQAVAFYLSEHVQPTFWERSWLTKFEVDDSGPDEALMRSMLAPHMTGEGSIAAEDFEDHLAAYLEPAASKDHVAHLHAHFKVKAVSQ